ncbi:hypothetical protein INR49_015361 [Caranx melampygus]|nr:hypothetical protein INR49_015361 [Caranx melampygus]
MPSSASSIKSRRAWLPTGACTVPGVEGAEGKSDRQVELPFSSVLFCQRGQHHSSHADCWGSGLGWGERENDCVGGEQKHVPAASSGPPEHPERLGAEEGEGQRPFSSFHVPHLHREEWTVFRTCRSTAGETPMSEEQRFRWDSQGHQEEEEEGLGHFLHSHLNTYTEGSDILTLCVYTNLTEEEPSVLQVHCLSLPCLPVQLLLQLQGQSFITVQVETREIYEILVRVIHDAVLYLILKAHGIMSQHVPGCRQLGKLSAAWLFILFIRGSVAMKCYNPSTNFSRVSPVASPTIPKSLFSPPLLADPRVLGGVNPSVVEAGAVARAGAGSGPAGRDWNVAAVAAVVKVDRGTGRVRGNGPGC